MKVMSSRTGGSPGRYAAVTWGGTEAVGVTTYGKSHPLLHLLFVLHRTHRRRFSHLPVLQHAALGPPIVAPLICATSHTQEKVFSPASTPACCSWAIRGARRLRPPRRWRPPSGDRCTRASSVTPGGGVKQATLSNRSFSHIQQEAACHTSTHVILSHLHTCHPVLNLAGLPREPLQNA